MPAKVPDLSQNRIITEMNGKLQELSSKLPETVAALLIAVHAGGLRRAGAGESELVGPLWRIANQERNVLRGAGRTPVCSRNSPLNDPMRAFLQVCRAR